MGSQTNVQVSNNRSLFLLLSCWVINTGHSPLSCLAFGPSPQNMYMPGHVKRGRYVLATGHKSGWIRLWDGESTQIISNLCSHKHKVTGIAFSKRTEDGNPVVISISSNRELKVW